MPVLGDGSRQSFNDRARRACDNYLEGKSLRESLILAGYSEQYATKKGRDWLKNREILNYLHTRRLEMQQQDSYKKFDFLKFLRGKLDDANIDEKARVEYAKLLSKVKGFDKDIELLEKKLEWEMNRASKEKTESEHKSINIFVGEAKKPEDKQ